MKARVKNSNTSGLQTSLYDLNASAIKSLPVHTEEDWTKDEELITEFSKKFEDTHFILLCKNYGESFYCTMFRKNWTMEETMGHAVVDCLKNIGPIHDITEEEDHLECWCEHGDEMVCLLFFKYDHGVIEVKN